MKAQFITWDQHDYDMKGKLAPATYLRKEFSVEEEVQSAKLYMTSLGNFCVPIILYAPGDSTLRGYDRQRIVEQADIMPTVLSYLHYDHPYLAFGKNMLDPSPEASYALHWVAGADGYEFVKGDYAIEFDGKEVTAAYRYRTDSLLTHNVLQTMPQDTLRQMTRQMKSIIQQYMQRMTNDKLVVE